MMSSFWECAIYDLTITKLTEDSCYYPKMLDIFVEISMLLPPKRHMVELLKKILSIIVERNHEVFKPLMRNVG